MPCLFGTRVLFTLTLFLAISGRADEVPPYWVQKDQAAPDIQRFSRESGLVSVSEVPPFPGASSCSAAGINNRGVIIGSCLVSPSTKLPALFDGTEWTVLDAPLQPEGFVLYGFESHDLTDDGTLLLNNTSVTATFGARSYLSRILLHRPAELPEVVASCECFFGPIGPRVNNAREVVLYQATDGVWESWLWRNGSLESLAYPAGASFMRAVSISDNGLVLAQLQRSGALDEGLIGMVRYNGVDFDIKVPGSSSHYLIPRGINRYGDVVGFYQDPLFPRMQGFLLHAGKFYSLTLTADEWDNLYLIDINDNGEIVAWLRRWDSALGRYVDSYFKISVALDHDEDGLPTRWEREGLKDEQGNVTLDLPAMGADPLRKDVFLEVDYTAGEFYDHQIHYSHYFGVVDAFSKAPIENPDGSFGITLHIDGGRDFIMSPSRDNPAAGPTWGDLSRANLVTEVRRDQDGYTVYDLDGPNRLTDADKIYNNAEVFETIRQRVFHHALIVDRMPDGSSGNAPTPGAYLAVARDPDANVDMNTTNRIAVTSLMHELGHNLGLWHNSSFNEPGNVPNYLSVMNYSYSAAGIPVDDRFKLDFSLFDASQVAVLNEANLNEYAGVISNETRLSGYWVGYYCAGTDPSREAPNFVPLNAPVNWNCNKDENNNDLLESSVQADVNGDVWDCDIHVSQRDWDAGKLIFAAGFIGDVEQNLLRVRSSAEVVAESGGFVQELPADRFKNFKPMWGLHVTKVPFKTAAAGAALTFPIKITNIGTLREEDVEVTSTSRAGWANLTEIPVSAHLAVGEAIEFDVTLSVPSSALTGDQEEIVIVARRRGSIDVLDTTRIRVTVADKPSVKANAGPDRAEICASASGTPVNLKGSASEGTNLTYNWAGLFGQASGTNPTVSMPIGTSTVTLTVSDGNNTATDTLDISVHVGVSGFGQPLSALVEEGQQVVLPDAAFKQGRTLPLKLALVCGDEKLTDAHVVPPRIAGLTREGEALALDTINLDAGQANDSGNAFRSSEEQWVYNLGTQSLIPGTYHITIALPDGRNVVGGFVLR